MPQWTDNMLDVIDLPLRLRKPIMAQIGFLINIGKMAVPAALLLIKWGKNFA